MILQRLASALRRQDWFQVVIEVLIVVIGIFLGLQVQAWYEEKLAKEVEQQFISYLIADSENTIAYLDRMDDFYQSRMNLGIQVLEILQQEELAEQQKETFERGIRRLYQNSELTNYLGTFLNGDLDQILDGKMRRTIDNYLSNLNTSVFIMQEVRNSARIANDYINSKFAVGTGIDSVVTGLDNNDLIYYEFDKLKNDYQLRIAIANSIRETAGFKARSIQVKLRTETLLPILKSYQAGENIAVEDFR